MNKKSSRFADPWYVGTFEGARDQVLHMGLETTFREKLEWLEEAENLSLMFRLSREKGMNSRDEHIEKRPQD